MSTTTTDVFERVRTVDFREELFYRLKASIGGLDTLLKQPPNRRQEQPLRAGFREDSIAARIDRRLGLIG
jgi:transcriptional regulator of acetoin/glycerol metabolism